MRNLRVLVAASRLLFCMWAGNFAARPVRETLATILGRQQFADLWIVTALISIPATDVMLRGPGTQ